jgi:hypothetical protein
VSLNQFIIGALTSATSGSRAETGEAQATGRVPRSLRLALIANAVVVALAAATAIVVLALGWR